MPNPIDLCYSPTPEDYVACLREFTYRDRRIWIALAAWLGITIVIIYLFLLGTFGSGLVPFVIVFIFPLLSLFYLFSGPGRVGRQARRNPVYTSEVRLQVDSRGLHIDTREEAVELPWDSFIRAWEIKEHFLLFRKSDPRQFQFIPKRAFESPEQIETFRKLVEEHLV